MCKYKDIKNIDKCAEYREMKYAWHTWHDLKHSNYGKTKREIRKQWRRYIAAYGRWVVFVKKYRTTLQKSS